MVGGRPKPARVLREFNLPTACHLSSAQQTGQRRRLGSSGFPTTCASTTNWREEDKKLSKSPHGHAVIEWNPEADWRNQEARGS